MTQEDDYSYILRRVLDEVKDLKKGVLFRCIEIMAPESAIEITKQFSIDSSNSFHDDLQVLNQIPSFQPVLKSIDPMNIRSMSLIVGLAKKPVNWNPSISVGAIIVVALVAISLFNLQRRNDMGSIRPFKWMGNRLNAVIGVDTQRENETQSSSHVERAANLWLVIPCNRLKQPLRDRLCLEYSSSTDETVTLLNESVYFLAKASSENNMPGIQRNDGWKDFPEGGDLFVRLHIPDGDDLIDVKFQRRLSRSLPGKEGITIKEIGLLDNLNNLEKFHRA